MAIEPKRYHIDETTNLASLLDEASRSPVLLERNGTIFRLSQTELDDVWAGYDTQAVKAALRQSAGAFSRVDAEALKRDIRIERGQFARRHSS